MMEDANILLGRVLSAKERYGNLLTTFNAFIAHITVLLTAEERLDGVTIEQNPDNTLTIQFLDRTLIAKYNFSVIKASRVGSITCCLMPNETDGEIKVIQSFTFTTNGETSIPVPNNNDPYDISSRVDCASILAYWLSESLN